MRAWLILIIAGIFEMGFTTFMKLSAGFSKWPYLIPFAACAILSFVLLTKAVVHIPLGTGYAVWTGIGAFGTALLGMLFFKEPVTILRIVFLITLVISIIGLKAFSPTSQN